MVLFLAPLIPWIMGAAGVYGAGKAVGAIVDSSDADDLNKSSSDIVNEYSSKLEEAKKSCNECLSNYGALKLNTYNTSLSNFAEYYQKLKNVDLRQSAEFEKLKLGDFSNVELQELVDNCNIAASTAKGVVAGLGGGALVAFGAYSGTMALGCAGTGAAISGLSGIAATNATLAWLGGGTLAAGGGGMALGGMVLGSIVAGPALLIFGSIMGSSAASKLNEAKANKEKALTYVEQVQSTITKLWYIKDVTNLAVKILTKTGNRLEAATDAMVNDVLIEHGRDYSSYGKAEKHKVLLAVKYAQLVKAIIDKPILNDDGKLVATTKPELESIENETQMIALSQ